MHFRLLNLIYYLSSRIVIIVLLLQVEDDDSVASASASGSLHIWRVEYASRGTAGAAGGGSGRGGGSRGGSGMPDKYTGESRVHRLHDVRSSSWQCNEIRDGRSSFFFRS